MYHIKTLAEFNTWHDVAKASEGIINNGKVGCVNGVLAPDNQKTVAYSKPIQKLDLTDEYIFSYGKYPIDGAVVYTSIPETFVIVESDDVVDNVNLFSQPSMITPL